MSDVLDRFFAHYYRRRPVNATFTGVHAHDDALPDWSLEGLASLDAEMAALGTELRRANTDARDDHGTAELDAALARDFLDIQRAETAGGHGVRRNPALWTGEAVFSVISLMTREFAPLAQRAGSATARLEAIPGFLEHAAAVIGSTRVPGVWISRALRECDGAAILLAGGVDRWLVSGAISASGARRLRSAADAARAAFARFAEWLRTCSPASDDALAGGSDLYDLLLARGHHCASSRGDVLTEAKARFAEARARLAEMTSAPGSSWNDIQERLATDHAPPDAFLAAFRSTWEACHAAAKQHDVVTWPEWPLRYVPIPEWTREAAPFLYYLYYRSPAPLDVPRVHEYTVPTPLPGDAAFLRTWNHSTIKLNHVVHHGAVGHHVQNWHAYHRARSRVGRVAAVDCASRIAMFCGGTMAEGWACYVTDLMEELGFFTPDESAAAQHSRVRQLARAIVDIELHQGTMSFDDAIRFYVEQVEMPAAAARAECTKTSMFPCTAVMYWLGTQAIHDLRDALRTRRGAAFELKAFHDELLGYGSVPVPLVARRMLEHVA